MSIEYSKVLEAGKEFKGVGKKFKGREWKRGLKKREEGGKEERREQKRKRKGEEKRGGREISQVLGLTTVYQPT